MKVVIATAHDEAYQPLADITFPTVHRYAKKHGYELHYDPRIDPREADACKARIFLDLYKTGAYSGDDVFMWIDTDALVMNSAFTMPRLSNHFLWGYDFNGPNSGVWFARFTSHAAHYVKVYALTARAMGWGDQEAMVQKMLVPPFRDWVSVVPGKLFNCYPYELHGIADWPHKNEINNYEKGDFILHAAGLDSTTRLQVLKHYAALAT